jgi:hypothetical protein
LLLGAVYAVSIAVFGGSAQFIEQLLIDRTGSPIAPAFYMTAALGIGVIGIFVIEEAGRKGKGVETPLAPLQLSRTAWRSGALRGCARRRGAMRR